MSALHFIIPAAGVGSRMQADRPKQYLSLLGKPILTQTLTALMSVPYQSVTLAVHSTDPYLSAVRREWPSDWQVNTVVGGAERYASVHAALISLQAHDDDWVAIHDAARPCVLVQDIQRLLDQLDAQDAIGGLLGIPVSNTLKNVQANQVLNTQDRQNLWQALTPQVFRYGALKTAFESLQDHCITDDAAVMEQAGHTPLMVSGDPRNIKITQPHDLLLAELFLPAVQQANRCLTVNRD